MVRDVMHSHRNHSYTIKERTEQRQKEVGVKKLNEKWLQAQYNFIIICQNSFKVAINFQNKKKSRKNKPEK